METQFETYPHSKIIMDESFDYLYPNTTLKVISTEKNKRIMLPPVILQNFPIIFKNVKGTLTLFNHLDDDESFDLYTNNKEKFKLTPVSGKWIVKLL